MKKKLFSPFVLFCFMASVQAQKYDENFELLKNTYPEERVIDMVDFKTIEISLDKEKLHITQSYNQEKLYLDERAKAATEDYLQYNNFVEIANIKAASHTFESGKYRKNIVKEFNHKDVLSGSFYDDVKQIDFVYPNLGTASKTELRYDEIIKNPRFINPVYLGKFNPILHKKVEFVVDEQVEISFKSFNTENFDIRFTTDTKRNKKIYTWEAKNIPAFKYENSSSNAKEILPHIVPIINAYTVDNQRIEVLGEVAQLYNWYYSMVKDINVQPISPALKEKAIELTKDKKTELEKVNAIYTWVQQEVKYIAFEYDLGGFIPREANDVFQKRYGDCKDNSSLIQVMLAAVGIKSYLTWVGTRKLPYTYEELPTPHTDNHMITSYQDAAGNTYYLDATGRYHTPSIPTSFIQGKEVLIGFNEKDFMIKKVEFVPPSINYYKEVTSLQLEDANVKGNSSLQLNGYPKIELFYQLEEIKNKDLQSFYRNRFQKDNSRFVLTQFEEKNKFSYEEAFELAYDFEIPEYAKKVGDELYLNLNLNNPLISFKTNQEFVYDIEIENKESYAFENRLKIPSYYEVTYVPESKVFSNPFFDASIDYQVVGNELVYTHSLTIHFIRLNAQEQKEVNAAIEEVQKEFRELIILKKTAP